jgi:hypothetical protein
MRKYSRHNPRPMKFGCVSIGVDHARQNGLRREGAQLRSFLHNLGGYEITEIKVLSERCSVFIKTEHPCIRLELHWLSFETIKRYVDAELSAK